MKKRGFTLVELLIVISIISVLSVVGINLYSGVQKSARDAKRKSDLRSIKVALELYKQTNGSYPITPGNWVTSASGSNWIPGLDSNYFPNGNPKDPLQSGSNSWYWVLTNNISNSYYYAYWSQNDPACVGKGRGAGQFFALVAQLENRTDSERNEVQHYKWCSDKDLDTVGDSQSGKWSGSVFVVTSL